MRWVPVTFRERFAGTVCVVLPAVTAAVLSRLATSLGMETTLSGTWGFSWFLTQSLILAAGLGDPRGVTLRAERVLVYHVTVSLLMAWTFLPLAAFSQTSCWLAWPLCGAAVLTLFRRYFFPDADHLRGRRLIPFSKAERAARGIRGRGDRGLPWGGLRVPTSSAVLHFLAIGASGSGKTLTIRMLTEELLRQVTKGSGRRALVYDAKRDGISTLFGLEPECPVRILNPFDRRSSRWAIAKDARTPAVCLQIAETLIRTEPGPNQFFSLAGIEILSGVMVALNLTCPERWDLRDMLLATRDPETLQRLLERHPETRGPLIHFAEPRTLANILSTVRVKLAQLEPIAAAWSFAESEVSLEEWATSEMILVLGNDETTRVCLDALNRAILRRAVELVLNGSETTGWRTLFVLDEVGQAGKLDALSSLLTKGRSKGASVVLGFQDMDGLREVYDKAADEIVGQCATKALLRIESPNTAEWASRAVGEFERWERQVTTAVGGNSTTHQRVKREAALPSEFLSLPAASQSNGLTGYFVVPEVGAFRRTIPAAQIRKSLTKKAEDVPDFMPRADEEQYLQPWTAEDLFRLGFGRRRLSGSVPGREKSQAEGLRIVKRLPGVEKTQLRDNGE